ncbi:replication initiation protein, partial [Acidocella facilis]|uniref:replication initiation protein n=1 Tax=Acidocella facilis TaxID=525 RepID=UPI001F3F7E2C
GLERVRESLRRLLGVQVTVTHNNEAGAPRVLQTILFSHFDTPLSGPGDLIFGIPKELRAILAKSGRWGRIKAEVVHAMSSKYAIALYELLRLRANMDNCVETLPIDRFRALLGVPPGTYADGANFLKKVIEPAVLEVNGLSELGCKIELVRVHSRAPASKVVLAWWKKGDEEQRPAIQELNRSKLGRKARLRGQVETVQA